jgi:truncated hemoglobin YjbI
MRNQKFHNVHCPKRPSFASCSTTCTRRTFSSSEGSALSSLSHYPHLSDNQYAILRQIRHDLLEADVNKDGRIDFEELKMVLQNYPMYEFSEREIEEIGDLFFVGRSGGSVKHATFMRGIQHIIASNFRNDDDDTRKRNPLELTSVQHKGCWLPDNNAPQLHNVQEEFENSMWKFVQEVHTLDQVGGKEAVEKFSDEFYGLVIHDERLKPLFEGKPFAKLKKHPYNFMRIAFTGSQEHSKPEERDKQRIRNAHARLEREKGLNQRHFDLMLEHFVATLQDDGNVSEDVIDTAVDVVMTYRDCFAPAEES